jgi:hypothetical protein
MSLCCCRRPQQGLQETHKKKGEVQSIPRNIVTGPSKKGGFGFNKTTLSERKGATGVAGEYAYMADPIHEATRQKETAPPVVSDGCVAGDTPPRDRPPAGVNLLCMEQTSPSAPSLPLHWWHVSTGGTTPL